MTGLMARSIDTVDGETTSTTARTASHGILVVAAPAASASTTTTSGTSSLPPGQATFTASSTSTSAPAATAPPPGAAPGPHPLNIGPGRARRLGESTVQPVGRPLMGHPRRRAHDKHPTFVDFEAGVVTEVWQRLDIVRCPWSGVLHQRNAHARHLPCRLLV